MLQCCDLIKCLGVVYYKQETQENFDLPVGMGQAKYGL